MYYCCLGAEDDVYTNDSINLLCIVSYHIHIILVKIPKALSFYVNCFREENVWSAGSVFLFLRLISNLSD